jgi:2-hydroxychromene-2-carboxylate isomerase
VVFYYDVSSPYAYLAAERIDGLLPQADWRPFSFGVLLRETGRVPWSMRPDTRADGQAEVARRAGERGLPPVRWPHGWPADSYSLLPLRALYAAERDGRLKELTMAMFRQMFEYGTALDRTEPILAAAEAAGLDPGSVGDALAADWTSETLRAATTEAIGRGLTGVPTVAAGDELFWGDDRLEDAVAALNS